MGTDRIKTMAERLKCTYIKNSIDAFVEESAAEGWGVAESLEELLSRECETRRLNGIRRRMSRAPTCRPRSDARSACSRPWRSSTTAPTSS